MHNVIFMILVAVLSLSGCAGKTPAPLPVAVMVPDRAIDYSKEVKPILVKRCIVCHSCYNSPCQLKLSSYDGIDRGATKEAVYNAGRLKTMNPTRLFVDARNTSEWRSKGFYSVTGNSAEFGYNNSFMIQLLDHKMKNPKSRGEYHSEAADLTCAQTGEELGAYLEKHPNGGMPFGFPPLKESEFQTIAGWLVQGAAGPGEEEQSLFKNIPPIDRKNVALWETFFNGEDAKHAMTARYLYEHLFLAHITFNSGSEVFYELVRSSTGSGEPVKIIPTVRPYDDPGGVFYYRFRKIYSTIVHKTHMVFDLGEDRLQRIRQLFIEPEWPLPPHRVGYEQKMSANPFRVFEQIPAKSRYQFLLDNVHYIIMTFIRGPVCKGQIALNVIHDNFWVFFLDPEYDLSVQYPGFLQENIDLLEMPASEITGNDLFKAFRIRNYRAKAAEFVKKRQYYYSTHYYYQGLEPEAIWAGNMAADSPALTVYRHFDSASVHRGLLGDLPRTMWVIDFPLLERIYYSLVAGFNIYGNGVHQLSTRVYMDVLRQEGETYFLDFMPKKARERLMKDWYGGLDLAQINYNPSNRLNRQKFKTDEPKREFIEHLVANVFKPEINVHFDGNYLSAGEEYPMLPDKYESMDDLILGFKGISKPGVSFFTTVAGHNANLAYIRIKNIPGKEDVVVSVVINRWHDDVSTLFLEKDRLNPEKDSAAFIKGFVGSYPNYFFQVDFIDFGKFLNILDEYDGGDEAVKQLEKFGVNRADENFWDVYDWFQKEFDQSDPLRSGLFDLNRYYYMAIQR
ncbi:MAG: fatty acid cis/trans isomerase [Deltaproteobacteria bacterium]|nr:fatty acid cis/trans isomerase [Deltaproteobacteria bacterium]